MTPCTCEDTQNFYSTKNKPWDFPGGPHLAMLGTHILSLVGELRSHMLAEQLSWHATTSESVLQLEKAHGLQ